MCYGITCMLKGYSVARMSHAAPVFRQEIPRYTDEELCWSSRCAEEELLRQCEDQPLQSEI